MHKPRLGTAQVQWFSERRKPGRSKAHTAPQIAALRLKDLAKLFRGRYGITLPDDDAGRDDLAIALAHIASLATARERMIHYCEIWVPWMTLRESNAMMAKAFSSGQYWTADQLAWRLRLTMADRTALGITTIGAIDMGKAARTKNRKAKARARDRKRRRANGIKPRREYLASIKRGPRAP